MTTLPAVAGASSPPKTKKKKRGVRVTLPHADGKDIEHHCDEKAFPPTPYPGKLLSTQSPRARRARPHSAVARSPRRKRPMSAKVSKTPSVTSLTPSTPVPSRPTTSPTNGRGRRRKKKAASSTDDAAATQTVIVPRVVKAEKCGKYTFVGELKPPADKSGKKKRGAEEELTGAALRRYQGKEEGLQRFDARALIDSTDFSTTVPTFTSEDISLDGCDAPVVSVEAKDEFMEKILGMDRILRKADESLAAKLRALEGKPDYRTRESLERFGVKLQALHDRLRADQATAFAQWCWQDSTFSDGWTWLEKAQARYNAYTSSDFYVHVKDSKPYKLQDRATDKVRFVTLANLFMRLFLDCISVRLQHTVTFVHASLLRQGTAAADTVVNAFNTVNEFSVTSATMHAVTADRLGLLDDSYGALKMRALDLKQWSTKALKADARAALVAHTAAAAAAAKLAWAEKDAGKLVAARAARIAKQAARYAFIIKLSNNALVQSSKCHFAALRATQASDFLVATIVINHVSAALAHRQEREYRKAIDELSIVESMVLAPRAVVAIMARTLRGEAGEEAYEKLRPWWHNKSALRAMDHLMRYPDDYETAQEVFREDIAELKQKLDRSLAAERAAAQHAFHAARSTEATVHLAEAAEDIALIEFLGQSLREARQLSQEQHFARSLSRLTAVDARMRARFLDLQSLHRSGIWEWAVSENATQWLDDGAIMQELCQLETWLQQVLGAMRGAARAALDAGTFAISQASVSTTLIMHVADVACRKLQSFARGIIARREFNDIMTYTAKNTIVEVLFRACFRLQGRFFFISAQSRGGQLLRIYARDCATGEQHIVPAGEKEFILLGLLGDRSKEAKEISSPIVKALLESYFESRKGAMVLFSKAVNVGKLAMFITATSMMGMTTITALESENGKMHTYQIGKEDENGPAMGYKEDGTAFLTEDVMIAYIATKLSPFYTGIKRSNSVIAREAAIKENHKRIQQVLNPAPIDYVFKEVKADSDLPVMVSL